MRLYDFALDCGHDAFGNRINGGGQLDRDSWFDLPLRHKAEGATVVTVEYPAVNPEAGESAAPYTHEGREFDGDTDLQYGRARCYDPTIGRWLSQEPMGFEAGDSNLYRYVEPSR